MSSLECQVCLSKFNDTSHKPRSLGCGHTLCTNCVRELLTDGIVNTSLRCAICRRPHNVSVNRVSEVPINFTLLSLVEGFKNRPRELFLLAKSEAQDTSNAHLVKHEDSLSRLQTLRAQLLDQSSHVVKMLPQVPQVVKHLENLQTKLSTELEAVDRKLKQGVQQKKKLEDAQKLLNAANTTRELNTAVDHLDEHQKAVRTWWDNANSSINYETVRTAEQVRHI